MKYQLNLNEMTLVELLQLNLALDLGLIDIDESSKIALRQYIGSRQRTVEALEETIDSSPIN